MRTFAFLFALSVAVACARTARRDAVAPLPEEAPLAAAREAGVLAPPALAPQEMVEHFLSRMTFGARPADRDRIQRVGISAFFEEQLHPEQLDDSALQQRLQAFEVVQSGPDALMEHFVDEQRIRRQEQMLSDEPPAPEDAAPESPAPPTPGPKRDYATQLAAAKVLRAVESPRQLQEVMVDFWFNHFNVFAGKDAEAALLPSYEETALRRHALGTFPELLEATAHSPAMLIYLDNWRSAAPRPRSRQRRGINENYARELLELQTLGVDGGYTQKDVVEVARCFTGWTVDQPRKDPRFAFRPQLHDFGEKRVLGHVIAAGGGVSDGEQVLRILETHPATARFIATKLARRFVSDDPPPALVDRLAATWSRTGGDIASMLRVIVESPEFWSRRALRAKVRSPLELVAGEVRALGARVDDPMVLARVVARIGEPLYGAQPPTGYPDRAQTWLSPGALLARIDFGLRLARGEVPGVAVDLTNLQRPQPEGVLESAVAGLGAVDLSQTTRTVVLEQLRSMPAQPRLLAARAVGLLLGSPEMQRR
jgi:uncharacterized protein (DUF1800 family)